MIISWSVERLISEIDKIKRACNDPWEDGFTTWGCKQDLYKLYWHLEEALNECGTYAGEEQFIKKHEQEKMLRILGKDSN
jgi:hypothetical protein